MDNRWFPPFAYQSPDTFAGMNVLVRDAQQQRRTPCDVRGTPPMLRSRQEREYGQ